MVCHTLQNVPETCINTLLLEGTTSFSQVIMLNETRANC